ncbi:hypothetical protein [Actinoplanes sp. L3-i22]|uniref:hypothetical protein n=1 Tax=Actinoplanes sp. L3-i22 TaxID=2836373 RepID=UPI001C763B71|nr:hypothetical protein [Actinoplanes sp. L3-i22]BCY09648.1 hypothetical protein L3i22_047360 [Actinoplanes sp. L3-i22]
MTTTTPKGIATAVACLMADHGFAFVEDDRVDALAATLEAFLAAAGLPVNPPQPDEDED